MPSERSDSSSASSGEDSSDGDSSTDSSLDDSGSCSSSDMSDSGSDDSSHDNAFGSQIAIDSRQAALQRFLSLRSAGQAIPLQEKGGSPFIFLVNRLKEEERLLHSLLSSPSTFTRMVTNLNLLQHSDASFEYFLRTTVSGFSDVFPAESSSEKNTFDVQEHERFSDVRRRGIVSDKQFSALFLMPHRPPSTSDNMAKSIPSIAKRTQSTNSVDAKMKRVEPRQATSNSIVQRTMSSWQGHMEDVAAANGYKGSVQRLRADTKGDQSFAEHEEFLDRAATSEWISRKKLEEASEAKLNRKRERDGL